MSLPANRGTRPVDGSCFPIVAVATSAGGLRALTEVLAALPAGFPAPVLVVQHLHPGRPSILAQILSHRTALTVKQAEEGDVPQPGTVYVAPPDRHLLVNADGTLSLSEAAAVHFLRPSADLLFESLSQSCYRRLIVVVLTGAGADGKEGIHAVKAAGGTVIAQDPATAEYDGMPAAAIRTGEVDMIVPLADVASQLSSLVERQPTE